MKKLIILMTACLSLAACAGDKFYSIFLHSYITTYVDGPIDVSSYEVNREKSYISIGMQAVRPPFSAHYSAPEVGGTGAEAEEFLRLAARNGDRTYDREVWRPGGSGGAFCFADNFKSVNVVCTNAAWDDAHPAGTPLNDIARLSYVSYAEYIRSGYTGEGAMWFNTSLSEIGETDLYMIATDLSLYLDVIPRTGGYELEMTLTTTEGEEKITSAYLHFE